LATTINQTSLRLLKEVAIQRCLSSKDNSDYQPSWSEVTLEQLLEELEGFFASHPESKGKWLKFPDQYPALSFRTDFSVLLRVLSNMLINALEATDIGGEVRVWCTEEGGWLTIHVWNRQAIPEELKGRIFQRNFSTKQGVGRGLGTFSMKFFGAEVLGGKVGFFSSPDEGTTCRFSTRC
jgi:signal transduction histidine kinase